MDTQWLEEGYKPREDNCREPGAEVSVHTAKPGRRLGAGKETMPGVGLRHLASWAGTTGWGGGAPFPGEQAGRVKGRWQWQLAGHAMSRMQRMPAACPSMSPRGSKCLGRGQEQAGCPGPPPHTCYPLIEGQALTWKSKRGQDCDPIMPLDSLPYLNFRDSRPPRHLPSKG